MTQQKKSKEEIYLHKASMFKGMLTGTIQGVMTWENITDKQRDTLKTLYEEYKAMEIVEK